MPKSEKQSRARALVYMPLSKRFSDLVLIVLSVPIVLPLCAALCCVLLIREGRPLFFAAPRVGQNGRPFLLLKFRTMTANDSRPEGMVCGGDAHHQISPFCAALRRYRLDELPQLWNVLRGEMTLVGPRPPDPRYVRAFPDIYKKVLKSRPGATGLATLFMQRYEARLLSQGRTDSETDALYCRFCIPRKARLDLIYQNQQETHGVFWFDLQIICQTLQMLLGRRRAKKTLISRSDGAHIGHSQRANLMKCQ